ncbi:MAG: dihydrofolate reductase [bacterium]|nr:MAG: dihydrofolate reductase [bacterium]
MKITLWMAISLNGIIATDDYKEDFLSHENWDEFVSAVQKSGCLIWGRKTYELIKEWPKSYLKPLKNISKVIISSDDKFQLNDGFILANSPEHAIEILAEKGFSEAILTGGSTNNSVFAEKNMIDEIILNIEGVIIGNGISLFKPSDFQLKLKLLSTTRIFENIIQVHYKVEK